MTNDQIVKIANSLSNDDLVRLIDAVSPRLEVFVGILNGCCITGSVEGACTNGTIIQINMEQTQLDDLREDEFFATAMTHKLEVDCE